MTGVGCIFPLAGNPLFKCCLEVDTDVLFMLYLFYDQNQEVMILEAIEMVVMALFIVISVDGRGNKNSRGEKRRW